MPNRSKMPFTRSEKVVLMTLGTWQSRNMTTTSPSERRKRWRSMGRGGCVCCCLDARRRRQKYLHPNEHTKPRRQKQDQWNLTGSITLAE